MKDPGGRPKTQDPVCRVDGCDRKPTARSMCSTHHNRWLKTGSTDEPVKPVRKPCSIDGCDTMAETRGWCGTHYSRWKRHGDPLHLAKMGRTIKTTPPEPCTIDGCNNLSHARTWCTTHYSRWVRHGNPHHVTPKPARKPCAVDGCNTPSKARGWCCKHYRRWRAHGDPTKSAAKVKAEREVVPAKTLIDPPEHLVAFLQKREARLKGPRGAANVTDGRGAGNGVPDAPRGTTTTIRTVKR